MLGQSGYTRGRVGYSQIRAAFVDWLKAPAGVKLLYVQKAVRMILRGEFGEALFRIQQWSTYSKWSRGAGMNARPKRQPTLFRFRLMLIRLSGGYHRRQGP